MHQVNTRKLTKQLNQALRRSWVIIQESEKQITEDAREAMPRDEAGTPIDELIRTVERFLDDVKATRNRGGQIVAANEAHDKPI